MRVVIHHFVQGEKGSYFLLIRLVSVKPRYIGLCVRIIRNP